MATEFKRNDKGEIEGITTIGDLIEEEPLTPEQKETQRIRAEFEKKYNIKRPYKN